MIAGSGEFPQLALDEASRYGYAAVVAGIRGEASGSLEDKAQAFFWMDPHHPEEALRFFKDHEVENVMLVGKVDPRTYFRRGSEAGEEASWLRSAADGTPSGLIRAFLDFLIAGGLRVMDPAPFLAPYFCPAGVLTRMRPSEGILRDAEFGWEIARRMADLDIGQTVVVKDAAVVAVEAVEGTDEAIRRAAGLAGPGAVAVKVSRTLQDLRVDVPAVGLNTVRAMVEAGCTALCLEAGKVAFFQKRPALELADRHGLVIFARAG